MKKIFCVLLVLCFASIAFAEQGLNKGQLERKLRFWTRTSTIDDSIMTEAINDGIQYVATMADAVIDTEKLALTTDTEIYTLPTNCSKLLMVCRYEGQCLEKVEPWDKGKIPGGESEEIDGLHTYWYVADDLIKIIGFQPMPEATDSAFLVFAAVPKTISYGPDSSVQKIDVREIYHPAVISACLISLWERLERFDKAERYEVKTVTRINYANQYLGLPPVDILMVPQKRTRP